MTITPEHLAYVLRLADNALILGQRNAEWCGHGPVLEEDIALANMSLDLIGQARLLYSHAATLESTLTGAVKTEDDYAYFRDERAFANYTLLELPHAGPFGATALAQRDYAVTIVRNYLYSALMAVLDPGDELLIPDPGWPNYAAIAHLAGATAVRYGLPAERGDSSQQPVASSQKGSSQ